MKELKVAEFIKPLKKKDLKNAGAAYAMELIENEVEPVRGYIAFKRLAEFVAGAVDAIKDRARDQVKSQYLLSNPGETEVVGAKVEWYPGKAQYDFAECPGWVRRKNRLETLQKQMNDEIAAVRAEIEAKYIVEISTLEAEIKNIETVLPAGSYLDPETGEVTDMLVPAMHKKDIFKVTL